MTTLPALIATEATSPFDYNGLDRAVATEARDTADRIRKRITASYLDTGRDLLAIKEKLDHGQFLKWLNAEFNMTERTARNLMTAAEYAKAKPEIISHLSPTAIYSPRRSRHTLRLHPQLRPHGRQGGSEGPKRLSDRSSLTGSRRGLRRSVALDETPDGRVHVHRGVALDPRQEDEARAILHKAGGKWGSQHHQERQVDLDQQTDVDGWIDNYNFRKARARNLGETPLYIARPLRQIARDNYERDRAIINSQQKPSSTISSSSTSPSTSPSSLILFAATGADHSPHSSPWRPQVSPVSRCPAGVTPLLWAPPCGFK